MKRVKKAVCGIMCVCMMFGAVAIPAPMQVKAGPESNAGLQMQRVAKINNDGVRLRSKASTNSTILELMYHGEEVRVHGASDGWCYVTRVKTGTSGYVLSSFIS